MWMRNGVSSKLSCIFIVLLSIEWVASFLGGSCETSQSLARSLSDAVECCNINDNVVTTCEDCDFNEIVDLSFLEITGIEEDAFNDADEIAGVKEVYLQGNKISEIPQNLFEEVQNVEIIDMSNNQITSLHKETFTGDASLANLLSGDPLEELLELNVSGNSLSSLPDGIFEPTESLQIIDLSRNNFESIGSSLFEDSETLIKIDLSHNLLTTIESEYFDGLSDLVTLELNNNDIETLESGSFDDLDALKKLGLRDNRMNSVPESVFDSNLNLKELDFSNNSIIELPLSLFSELGDLQELNLDYNALEELPQGLLTYSNNPALKNVWMRFNEIEVLSKSILEDFEGSSVSVHLEGNPGAEEPCPEGGSLQTIDIVAEYLFCLNISASPSPTCTPSSTISSRATATATASISSSPSSSFSPTTSPTASSSSSSSQSPTVTGTSSKSPTSSVSSTRTSTASSTQSSSHSSTATRTVSSSPSLSYSPTITRTASSSPSLSVSPTRSATSSTTRSSVHSPTMTRTKSPSPSSSTTTTGSLSPLSTATRTASPSPTSTKSSTASRTGTFSHSPTVTVSSSPSLSVSPTRSPTSSTTRSSSHSPTMTRPESTSPSSPTTTTGSLSPLSTVTRTASPSPTSTKSSTASSTGTFSHSPTVTVSSSPSLSVSPTRSPTSSTTRSSSHSPTMTRTDSPSSTWTKSSTFLSTLLSSTGSSTAYSTPNLSKLPATTSTAPFSPTPSSTVTGVALTSVSAAAFSESVSSPSQSLSPTVSETVLESPTVSSSASATVLRGSSTASSSLSQSLSPTVLETVPSTGISSALLTASPTGSSTASTSLTQLLSPTISEAVSNTVTSSAIISPTSFSSPSASMSSNSTLDPKAAESATCSPSISMARTPTTTATGAVTPSATKNEVSLSPSGSVSPSVTATRTITGTPSLTPSNILLPSNKSLKARSACGVISSFDCVTAVFPPSFEILLNDLGDTRTPINYVLEVNYQSTGGWLPEVQLSCNTSSFENVAGALYFGCDPQFKGSDLDFPLLVDTETRVHRNESCTGRVISKACRHFVLEISFRYHENASHILEEHLRLMRFADSGSNWRSLSGERIDLPLDVEFKSLAEPILAINPQLVFVVSGIELSESEETISINVFPQELTLAHTRETTGDETKNILKREVSLRLQAGHQWRWEQTPQSEDIVLLPKDGKMNETGVMQQLIAMHLSNAPVGTSSYVLRLSISDDNDVIKAFAINVTFLVRQGNIKVSDTRLDIARSMSEDQTTHSILAVNEGTHEVQWTAKVLTDKGEDVTNSSYFWCTLQETEGILTPYDEIVPLLFLTFLPSNVERTGLFEAWLLVETNSWEGTSQDLPSNWEVPLDAISNESKTYFWFSLNFLVTSLFVCDKGSTQAITLQPFEHKSRGIDVVNTELYPIRVIPTNFVFRVTNTSSRENSSDSNKMFSFPSHVGGRDLFLESWLSIRPPSRLIFPGRSTTFELRISYQNANLSIATEDGLFELQNVLPGSIQLDFSFSVYFLGNDGDVADFLSREPNDVRNSNVDLTFVPGEATPTNSYLNVSEQSVFVDKDINVFVTLVDHFGNEPANAIYTEANQPGIDKDLPSLEVKVTSETVGAVPASVTFPTRIREGQQVGSFSFKLRFSSIGEVRIDALINGTSMWTSPLILEGKPVECTNENEIPDDNGLQCVCKIGHHRQFKSGRCTPCPEGTFSRAPTNEEQCESCPSNFFSEDGSGECYPCLNEGANCDKGKLRMSEGYWCEICYDLGVSKINNTHGTSQYQMTPRDMVIAELKVEKLSIQFHECRNKNACITNSTTFETSCRLGHSGILCEECASGKVFLPESHTCVSCDKTRDIFLSACAFGLLLGTIIGLSYKYSASPVAGLLASAPGSNTTRGCEASRVSVVSGGRLSVIDQKLPQYFGWAAGFGEVVLIYVDYLQLMSIINSSEINPFESISAWMSPVAELSLFNPTQTAPVRCRTGTSTFINAIIVMSSPWIFICLIALVHIFMERVIMQAQTSVFESIENSLPVMLVFFNLMHASVADTTFNAFRQYPYPVFSAERMSMDLTIEVGSVRQEILFFVALVTVIIFVLGFPLGTMMFLYRKFQNISGETMATAMYHQYENLIGGFRLGNKAYLWPFFVILRKVLILLILTGFDRPVDQLAMITTVLLGSYMLASMINPYQIVGVTRLELVKLFLALSNSCFGALWFGISQGTQQASAPAKITLQIFVLACQIVMVLFALLMGLVLLPKAYEDVYRFGMEWFIYFKEQCQQCGTCTCCKKSRVRPLSKVNTAMSVSKENFYDIEELG